MTQLAVFSWVAGPTPLAATRDASPLHKPIAGRRRVPSLLAYELANGLRYKGDLTTAQVEEAIQSLFDMALEWEPPTPAMMRRAAVIARAADATVYDATFAALAESLVATFVTADERLVRRLEGWPFVIFLGEVENSQ